MTRTITLEGDIAAVDTDTPLVTQGSVAAPSRKVPVGMSKIDKIIVGAAADIAAVGSGVYIIRLGGTAVQRGEQVIVVAASGGAAAQTGADPTGIHNILAIFEDVDIEVVADIINVSAEMAGSDLGTARVVVTLVFA